MVILGIGRVQMTIKISCLQGSESHVRSLLDHIGRLGVKVLSGRGSGDVFSGGGPSICKRDGDGKRMKTKVVKGRNSLALMAELLLFVSLLSETECLPRQQRNDHSNHVDTTASEITGNCHVSGSALWLSEETYRRTNVCFARDKNKYTKYRPNTGYNWFCR
jgi:hypothetical protein